MKIFKIILGIIALFILSLIALGLIGPEIKIETSTSIKKPASEVYAMMIDESRLKEWMTGFKSMERISGNNFEVGAKNKLIFEEKGEKMEMIETITSNKKDKQLAFDFTNSLMIGSVEMNLESTEEGTNLNTTTLFKGQTFIFRAILPLFMGSMKKQMEGDYEKLKNIIEASSLKKDL